MYCIVKICVKSNFIYDKAEENIYTDIQEFMFTVFSASHINRRPTFFFLSKTLQHIIKMITKHYLIMLSVCISGFSGKLADFIIFGSTTPRRNVAGLWESSAPKQEATFHSILTPHRKEVSSSILSNCETFLLRLVMEGNRIEPSSSWVHGYWIISEYKMNQIEIKRDELWRLS